jgi:dsRNA-specific ribonuclease
LTNFKHNFRLLHETGRLTKEPIFIIGIYSGTEKLAEGFGSSLKMAEFRVTNTSYIYIYENSLMAIFLILFFFDLHRLQKRLY